MASPHRVPTRAPHDGPDNRQFGAQLRRLRRELGLSQAELGGDRFTGSYISHLESGRRTPSQEVTTFLAARLGVSPVELGLGQLQSSVAVRLPESESDLAALEHLLGAERAWHDQEWHLASRLAGRAAAVAAAAKNQVRHWEARFVLAQAQLSEGDYEAVCMTARELVDDPLSAKSAALKAQSLSLMSVASRAAGRLTEAISWGARAVEAAHGASLMLQAEAAMALISARSETGDKGPELQRLCTWLEEIGQDIESGYAKGLIAWALGTAAFRANDTAAGILQHEEALKYIKPQRDLRMWARLHKSIANRRLESGVMIGVAESIESAREGLRLAGNASDLLELHLVEAKQALATGKLDVAEGLVLHCLADEVLHQADHLAGEAEALHGDVCAAQGRFDDAVAAWARSATRFEAAGAFGAASVSWRKATSEPGRSSPTVKSKLSNTLTDCTRV